jgi:N-hydroxyarylamine O-acetyltransferase
VLRVSIGGAVWHADVGFGVGTLAEPIPFGPGGIHEQSGWRFRVVEQGVELVLQGADGERWTDMYGFVPEPVPFVDVETSNWFACTHPRSPFVTGLVAAIQRPDGSHVSVSDWETLVFAERSPTKSDVRPVTLDEVPHLLETHFGLSGFTLNGEGRIVPEAAG